MLVDEDGQVNLYQMCDLILENPKLMIEYFSNEASMKPTI